MNGGGGILRMKSPPKLRSLGNGCECCVSNGTGGKWCGWHTSNWESSISKGVRFWRDKYKVPGGLRFEFAKWRKGVTFDGYGSTTEIWRIELEMVYPLRKKSRKF